ncbi:MAG TPA: 16S rRNA (cytidine(1402)-2'-O)-methyltransferase [Azospirillaceae bacterium]|nr:16S rRNA (cytidine(1402)-2'-O)-methyltransferase [Azospirillaceae bacterium]
MSAHGPTLHVIATPIGNLEDVTLRAIRVLGQVAALAVEDTRVTPRLLDRHGIPRPAQVFPCHEHNEDRAVERILEVLRGGGDVGLVTDAGMPGISDPGFRAVRAVLEAGFRVEVVPGPAAVTTALVVSGLPVASFTFLGFPPRTSGKRRNLLAREAQAPHTLVFYESPHRVKALLADALAVLGDRQAAVCLELTKLHERVHRGHLTDLVADKALDAPKGEITVVIAGNARKFMRGETPASADGDADETDGEE